MEKVGKIYNVINKHSGYIIDEEGNLYLFFKSDILDDTKVQVGEYVYFKADFGKVKRATYISKFNKN